MLELLLTILIAITSASFSSIYAQESNPVSEQLHLDEYACIAKDPASFKDCIVQAQTTAVPFIRIAAPIVCTSAGDCAFEIKGLKTFLRILSPRPENLFIRRGSFNYTLMNVEDSEKIEFVDLNFVDENLNGCPTATVCPDLFTIKNSSTIKLERVRFKRNVGSSLNISDSRDVSVLNSEFIDSSKTALTISTNNFTSGLRIEKNNFVGNAGTALTFQAFSLGAQSLIQNNTFTNNHSRGVYSAGTISGGNASNCNYPCTGAQIQVLGPTTNLKIAENTITGGENTVFDSLGLYASGIDIGGQNVKDTTLYCNEISGNRGSAIVQSPPFTNVGNIQITENKIWGNGLTLNIPTGQADDNNCYTQECKLSCKPTP